MTHRSQIISVDQVLTVAQALPEQDAVWEALEIAQYGLTLRESQPRSSPWAAIIQSNPLVGYRYQFADWTYSPFCPHGCL